MTELRDDEWELSHLYVLIYDDAQGLGMCGCGQPEDGYNLVRDLLNLAPWYEDDNWRRCDQLIGTPGAVQLVLSQLDRVGLVEHGGSIGGSWLTPKGEYARHLMRRHEYRTRKGDDGTVFGVVDAGYPHDDNACTPECWVAPDGVLPPDPPAKSLDDLREAIQREVDEARARMSLAQRAVMDATEQAMTNMLLHGSLVAPENPPQSVLPGVLEAFDGSRVDWPIGLPAGHWSTVRSDEIVIPDPGYVGRLQRAAVSEQDRLPRGGRNAFIGCRQVDRTWIHGRPHDCPRHARGPR